MIFFIKFILKTRAFGRVCVILIETLNDHRMILVSFSPPVSWEHCFPRFVHPLLVFCLSLARRLPEMTWQVHNKRERTSISVPMHSSDPAERGGGGGALIMGRNIRTSERTASFPFFFLPSLFFWPPAIAIAISSLPTLNEVQL